MQPIQTVKSVVRQAIESWNCEVTKDCIAERVARMYHKLHLRDEPDAQLEVLLKVPSAASSHDNMQRFWRYLSKDTVPAKANILDLLPAVIAILPVERASAMLNAFLNPLGYSVARIGAGGATISRDMLLANLAKEGSEALQAILKLPPEPTIVQLRACYKELQESEAAHGPLMRYVESQMALHEAA
ncbi:toxin YdaT family protein [Celerinatantimonas sp. MCCC 1A17872]|uniref:toxin YdaT family protein n=1 Tax=Celerinatantimonas sp. MCCC 1A17872 TaxID=3177514 RepID=UPI0038C11C1B